MYSNLNYAFIKNGTIVNIVVFDSPTDEILETYKTLYEADTVVLATLHAEVGGHYDGINFIRVKGSPYSSWIWSTEVENWVAPVNYPTDSKHYYWDENTVSWVVIEE
jgi:hypothetical protein